MDEFADRLLRRYGANATLVNPDGPAAWDKIRRWRQRLHTQASLLGMHEFEIGRLIMAIETNDAVPCSVELVEDPETERRTP